MTIEEYLGQQPAADGDEVEDIEAMLGYDQIPPEPKISVTPLRYDYHPDLYTQGRHPASHVHFGHGSNIRIGTDRALKPLSFSLLVLRQYYPDTWARLIRAAETEQLCRNVRTTLDPVPGHYWGAFDKWEMLLS
jgi:hypothetical protein